MSMERIFGHSPEVRSVKESNAFVLPRCNIGIEVELEQPTGNLFEKVSSHSLKYWRGDRDGSLRDNGVELILRQPLAGVDLEEAIAELSSNVEGECNFSERTSVHVHVDVRDMSMDQLFNFFMVYVILEKIIFKQLGNGREQNIFCIPIYAGQAGWSQFACDLFGKSLPDHGDFKRRSVGHLDKYSALNVLSLERFGSFEFRHMEGTANQNRLMWWVNLLQSMKRFAIRNDINPMEFLNTLSARGPESLVFDIFGNNEGQEIVEDKDFFEMIFDGIRLAQDFIDADIVEKKHYERTAMEADRYYQTILPKSFLEWCEKSKIEDVTRRIRSQYPRLGRNPKEYAVCKKIDRLEYLAFKYGEDWIREEDNKAHDLLEELRKEAHKEEFNYSNAVKNSYITYVDEFDIPEPQPEWR